MIDRVAKALYAFENGSTDGWDGPLLQERGREMWRQYARAAIEAMREPTDDMLKAAWRRNDDNDGKEANRENWQGMIDAALGKVDA